MVGLWEGYVVVCFFVCQAVFWRPDEALLCIRMGNGW